METENVVSESNPLRKAYDIIVQSKPTVKKAYENIVEHKTTMALSLLRLPAGAVAARRVVCLATGRLPVNEPSWKILVGKSLMVHGLPVLFSRGRREGNARETRGADKKAQRNYHNSGPPKALVVSVWTDVIVSMYGLTPVPAVTGWALVGFFLAQLMTKFATVTHDHLLHPNAQHLPGGGSFVAVTVFFVAGSMLMYASSLSLPATGARPDSTVFRALATVLLRMLDEFPLQPNIPEDDPLNWIIDHCILPAVTATGGSVIANMTVGDGLPDKVQKILFVTVESDLSHLLKTKGVGEFISNTFKLLQKKFKSHNQQTPVKALFESQGSRLGS